MAPAPQAATHPTAERAEYEARWEAHWTENGGLQRGQMWDISGSAPSLVHLLKTQRDLVEGKRCFVPGCGRGYDVLTLAQQGAATAVGLELAPSAVAAAQEELREQVARGTLTPAQAEVVELTNGNFFQWQHARGGFDFGYDYTFGCAMHPSMRKDWASNWARLLCRADGSGGSRLVTLVFPCDPARDPNEGPPFPVSPELYKELLEPVGFRLDHLAPVPHELSIPKRQGMEYLALWTLT